MFKVNCMNKSQITDNTQTITELTRIFNDILEELHLIRNEVMFLLPQDDLEDYNSPERIKNSYNQAINDA